MQILAAIGILSTLLAGVGLIRALVRLLTGRSAARLGPPPPDRSILTTPPGEDLYFRDKAAALARYREVYRQRLEKAAVPRDAWTVTKCASFFALQHVPLEHYAWCRDNVIFFFPRWRSMALLIADPAFLHRFHSREEERLFGWIIPADRLASFRVEEDTGLTVVKYEDHKGKSHTAVFLEGAPAFFRSVAPQKDHVLLERQSYLASQRNIDDMKAQMAALQQQLESGAITQEEYAARRTRILRAH